MKHAREDYNRIQDPMGLIPDDEPVLLFRGQDKHTAKIATIYADMVEEDEGDPEIVRAIREHVDRINQWPKKKAPDMPKVEDGSE